MATVTPASNLHALTLTKRGKEEEEEEEEEEEGGGGGGGGLDMRHLRNNEIDWN